MIINKISWIDNKQDINQVIKNGIKIIKNNNIFLVVCLILDYLCLILINKYGICNNDYLYYLNIYLTIVIK